MRVLVVEDNKRLADSIKKGLMQENYTVDVAYDGTEGYDLASEEGFDLIILDLMLPHMDGMEICKKLRSEDVKTPILMLTALSATEDKVLGLNSGADDYLTKPFEFSELLARMRAISRRPRGRAQETLEASDLSLNTTTHEVKRKGNDVSLSRKEYALLEYLMRNKGKVLTKEQIIDGVWPFDSQVLPNTVEVYVRYLRNKLGGVKLIHTIRGFGYKLIDK